MLSNMDVIIVNLRRRKDRKFEMIRWLPDSWTVHFLSDHNLDWDGANINSWPSHPNSFDWRLNCENPWWSRDLKPGEVGCSLSHIEVWRLVANSSAKYSLVLEDDVTPVVRFKEKISDFIDDLSEICPNWDLAYLGREPIHPDNGKLSDLTVLPGYSYGSYAYLLSRAGAVKLLGYNLQDSVIPVDEFLPASFIEHPRADVKARFMPTLKVFAADTNIFLHVDDKDSDTEGKLALG